MAVDDDSWTGEVACCVLVAMEWNADCGMGMQCKHEEVSPAVPEGRLALPLVRTRVHTYSLHIVCQYTAQIKLNLKTEENYFLTQLTNTFNTLHKKFR